MKKYLIGIILGVIAGIIDVIPMIFQKLTWDANLGAFSMWIVVGFLNVSIRWKINSFPKGIIIAFLVLLPSAFIIGWDNPLSLIPIAIMTIILGGFLGFSIEYISKKSNN